MSSAARFTTLAKLAERKERDAARTLAQARIELDQLEARLGDLKRFRQEYQVRIHGGNGGSLRVADLKRGQSFLLQLDQGVHQAEKLVTQANARWRRLQSTWREERSRMDAMEKMAARHLEVERRTRSRREQRAMDDQAGRRRL